VKGAVPPVIVADAVPLFAVQIVLTEAAETASVPDVVLTVAVEVLAQPLASVTVTE
jgi:hypothetical protein